MSTPNASERLRSIAGANIAESIGRRPGGPAGTPNLLAARPTDQDRYVGLSRVKGAFQIPPDRITPDPNQPRKEFEPEALERLARSLQERGQLQPIRVRWDAALDRWVIIAGERRWRAAVHAGLPTVAAVEAGAPLTEDEVLEEQLIENCIREDLKPIEQAKAYRSLMTSRGLTQVQLAERLNVGQGTIAKALALLTLPEPIQASVEEGRIPPAVGYEIAKVEDPAEQAALAREAEAGRIHRDEVKERTRAKGAKGRGAGKGKVRKVIERTYRAASGPRVTVAFRRGLDAATIATALREVLGQVEAELTPDEQAA